MPERYEREIEEIIRRTAADIGPRVTLRQAFRDLRHRMHESLAKDLPGVFRVVTPLRLGALGLALLIAGFIAKQPIVAIAAVAVLMSAYFLSIIRSSGALKPRPGFEPKWRGRYIESHPTPMWKMRLRHLFGRKKNTR